MIFDAHIDTLAPLRDAGHFTDGTVGTDHPTHVDLPRARKAGVSDLVLAICAEAEREPMAAWQRMMGIWDRLGETAPDSPALHLMAEGCEPLMSLPDIDTVIDGMAVASLTWNGENSLGGGIGSASGLTSRGREMAFRLNRGGVVLDVSHLSDRSRADLFSLDLPLVATHCNCRAVFDHPRNLPADDIREIGARGGVVGVNFVPDFLGGTRDIHQIVRHLEHIMDLAGPRCAGFGSDFDGTSELADGVADCTSWPAIIDHLEDEGWSEELVEAVCGGNWRRVFASC